MRKEAGEKMDCCKLLYIYHVMVAAGTNVLMYIKYAEKVKFYFIKVRVLIEIKIYPRTKCILTSVVFGFGTNETTPSEIILSNCVAFQSIC